MYNDCEDGHDMSRDDSTVVTAAPHTAPARFCSPLPRRNLPRESSLKRGGSNFVGAFYRAYDQLRSSQGLGGLEFSLPNFGIADLIWVCLPAGICAGKGRSGNAQLPEGNLSKIHITAFEMKLSEWRKALSQAYRYRYFADRSIVVLPPAKAKLAKEALDIFRELEIGLWSFDAQTGEIQLIFTPKRIRPKSAIARERALELIRRKLDLRQVGE